MSKKSKLARVVLASFVAIFMLSSCVSRNESAALPLGNGSIDNDESTYITHLQEKVMDNAIFVATSGDSSYAISRDGEVFAWGTGIVASQGGEEKPVLLPTKIFLITQVPFVLAANSYMLSKWIEHCG